MGLRDLLGVGKRSEAKKAAEVSSSVNVLSDDAPMSSGIDEPVSSGFATPAAMAGDLGRVAPRGVVEVARREDGRRALQRAGPPVGLEVRDVLEDVNVPITGVPQLLEGDEARHING